LASAQVIIVALKPALFMFVFGVLFGISAQGLAYLAQLSYGSHKRISGQRFRLFCIALAVGGVILFGLGAVVATQRILALT